MTFTLIWSREVNNSGDEDDLILSSEGFSQ